MYVRRCYREILVRDGSESEIKAWVNQMAKGQTRASVISDFKASSEYKDK